MIVIYLIGVISLCACQSPDSEPPKAKYVLCFDSEVFPVGDQSSKYIDTSGVCCERYNDSISYMYGHFDMLEDIDNLICEVIVQKEESGTHQVLFSLDICDLCKEMADEESDFNPYLKPMSMPTSCPLKAGRYVIHNLVVDTESLGINDQHCGNYIASIIIHRRTGESCKCDREFILHLKIEFSIEEQE